MDPVILAQQATDILVPALPLVYAGGKAVADRGKEVLGDMIYEKAFEKLGRESAERATLLLKKINPKIGSSLEKALKKVSGNPEDSAAKEDLQKEILKLLRENPDLAREIEFTINFNVENIDQLAVGNYNNFFKFETPSGDEFIKIIEYLDQRRTEARNQEILNRYNPSNLPYYPEKLKQFVTQNRAEELRKYLTYLENHRILLLSGIGGVGKSTLARALVDLRPINVPEPFWFNFNQNQNAKLGDILEKLAAYMKAPEIASFKAERREPGKTDVDKLTGELHRRSEIWIIFDDLSTILEDQHFADTEIKLLFSSLRYNTHNAKIITTSRILPMLENGESLLDVVEDEEKQNLKGLRKDFAVDYLASNGLEDVEPKKLEELTTGVDGHPLALKLLVELIKEFGVRDTLEDLSMYRESKDDIIKKARKLFDKLAGEEKELLERFSVYREPVDLKGLKEMFTENTPKNAVRKLINKSLLETDHMGHYWLHPLVQEFSYEDLKNKNEARMLAVKYYLSLPLPENPAKKEDLQPAIEAHYHACMAEEFDQAADIIWKFNLHGFLDLWGYPRTLIEIYEKMLPKDHFTGEPILKDNNVHVVVLGNLGSAYRDLGEPKKAIDYYEHSLKISRKIGDRLNEGVCLGNLGLAYRYLGEPKRAIEYSKQALEISREIGDRCNEGAWLGNLGLAYGDLSELKKAIEYYDNALTISREIGDRRREGSHLEDLGLAYSQLGETKKAIEYFKQTLRISREIGDRRREGNCLGNLGLEYIYLGESKKAIEYSEQALTISKEIGYRRGEGNCRGNLGNAHRNMGKLKKAIEYYEQALKIAREIGNIRGEGNCLGNLGGIYGDMGEIKKAIEYSEQALTISKEIGYRRGEGDHLGNLGLAYNHLGELKKAIEYYEQALKIAREIGNKRGEGRNLGFMGLAYSQLGEIKKAIEYYEGALTISKEMGYRRGEGDYLGFIGLAYSQLGETEKAIEYYEQALKIAREIGNRRGEGRNLGFMGNAYNHLGETKKAIEYSEQALTISKEIGYRRGEGDHLGNLGLAYNHLGETKKAIEYYEHALNISREIGYRRGEGNWLGNLGKAYSKLADPRKAIECYEQALQISREIGDKSLEGNTLRNMGNTYKNLGKPRKAIEFLKQSLSIGKAIEDPRIISFCEQKLKELEGSDE
jgi:tetratricopeptide (TPR) repeat protein